MEDIIVLTILVIMLHVTIAATHVQPNRTLSVQGDGVDDRLTTKWRSKQESSDKITSNESRLSSKTLQQQTTKLDEDAFRKKLNRDALIKKKKKEENFDDINRMNINVTTTKQQQTDDNNLRNDQMFVLPTHVQDWEEQLTSNRRKMKSKHNAGAHGYQATTQRKPNIILILTDDQDVELGSLNFMPRTLRLLRDGGAEFRHSYVTTPMCCPSRSSLLTGMYVHNHNVFTNNENCSSVSWQQTHETRTFATYLSNAGYRTGYFGKYLNKYNGSYIPPGWREWGGLIMNSRYYNYSINLNGKKIKHGSDYYKDYYPDLIANDSIAFLKQSKKYFSRKPVMLVLSFPAPHGPEDSAPQFSNMFFNVTTHHTPTYDYAPNPDKQWILQVTNKMQDIHKQFTDLLMTKRLQTLQSVDIAVERIYQELKDLGELDNTYIMYTSDHGYHLGQFGLVKGKSFPFEFDIRVPFLVRGPHVEPGTIVDDIVLNIDLAPTFLDIAGVDIPTHMDGRSVLSLLHHRPNKRRKLKWPDTFLIESSGRREIPGSEHSETKKKVKHNNGYRKKKIENGVTETTSTSEPDQDTNSTSSDGEIQTTTLETTVESDEVTVELDDDEEDENTSTDDDSIVEDDIGQVDPQDDNKISLLVQQTYNPVMSKLARLAIECQRTEFSSPCRPGQKWHCVRDGNRWRKHKCKFQRKCACFTPAGVIYTKLENEDRRQYKLLRSESGKRVSKLSNKRSAWWDQRVLSLFSSKRGVGGSSSRRKRQADVDEVSSVMEDLTTELEEAMVLEISMNKTISRCMITSNGNVNCSSEVYHDPRTWRQGREHVENKIRQLKSELELLKEIRKHLKLKRPLTVEADEDDDDLSEENKTSTETTTTTTTTWRNVKHDNISSVPTTMSTLNSQLITTNYTSTESTSNTTEAAVTEKTEDGFINRIDSRLLEPTRVLDRCVCGSEGSVLLSRREEIELAREARRRLKEERLRKKERKLKKKAKMDKECLSEKMNCFNHDNEHWRTPPFWTEGPFCFCMNANNNTYSCLRTINSTHNFLYCEFTTGLKTYYNVRIDPFQQWNRVKYLNEDELDYLSSQLQELKQCRGVRQCTVGAGSGGVVSEVPPTARLHKQNYKATKISLK